MPFEATKCDDLKLFSVSFWNQTILVICCCSTSFDFSKCNFEFNCSNRNWIEGDFCVAKMAMSFVGRWTIKQSYFSHFYKAFWLGLLSVYCVQLRNGQFNLIFFSSSDIRIAIWTIEKDDADNEINNCSHGAHHTPKSMCVLVLSLPVRLHFALASVSSFLVEFFFLLLQFSVDFIHY